MTSRSERVVTRSLRREHQRDQQRTGQPPMVSFILSGPPMIDVDAIEDDDDVVESTASAFDQVCALLLFLCFRPFLQYMVFVYKFIDSVSFLSQARRHKSGGSRRTPLVVDVESGGTTRVSKNRTKHQTDQANVELNNPSKSKTVASVEEPKFNCPICFCTFTEEMSTKCGHIFCNKCIRVAISLQAKCPTCRKKVTAKDLIRVFLPTTR